MNVRNQKSGRRRGRAMVRTVLGLGTAVAGVLAYLVTDASRVEAVIVPGILMCLLVVGVAFYGRACNRREWSAAWDAYADREVTRDAASASVDHETWSWAAMN